MKTPITKPIKGHPNFIIDENGKVWNQLTHTREKEYINPNGFSYVILDGYWETIAYLMKAAFFTDDNNMCIRHKDGDRTNNRLDNLYTHFDGTETLDSEGNEKKIIIMEIDPQTNEVIKFWDSITVLAEDLQTTRWKVSGAIERGKVINGRKFEQFNVGNDGGLFDYTEGKRMINVYEGNTLIATVKTYTEASKLAGISSQAVTNALNAGQRTKLGYYFEWVTVEVEDKDETPKVDEKKEEEKRPKSVTRNVEQYDLDGNLLKVWESVKEAAEATGINKSSIRTCIYGSTRTAGGYVWRYSKDNPRPPKPQKEKKPKGKPVTQYDRKGNVINQWENVKTASEATGVKNSNIRASINGITTNAGGYVWRWKDDPFYKYAVTVSTPEPSREVKEKPKKDPSTYIKDTQSNQGKRVCQYTREGELIKIWESATQAAKEVNNGHLGQIGRCCKGKCAHTGGYVWRYEGEPFKL